MDGNKNIFRTWHEQDDGEGYDSDERIRRQVAEAREDLRVKEAERIIEERKKKKEEEEKR